MRRQTKSIQILSLLTHARVKAKSQKVVIIIKLLNKCLMKSLNNNRKMGSCSTKLTTKVRLRLQMIFSQQSFAISVTRKSFRVSI